jgi:hypothetical protein
MSAETERVLSDDFMAEAREARARSARIQEIGPGAEEKERKEREWNALVEAEAALLKPGGEIVVTLSGDRKMTVKEPLALAWARALGRVMTAIRPLTALWKATQDGNFKALEEADQTALALQLVNKYIDPDKYEETVKGLFGALDALLGMDDGWAAANLRLSDVARLALALVRVTPVEELAGFFGSARAAVAAQAAAALRPRES